MNEPREEQTSPEQNSASPLCYAVTLNVWLDNGLASRAVRMPILPVGSLVDVDSGDPYTIKYWRFDANTGEVECVLHFVGEHDYESELDCEETRRMLIDAGFDVS